MIKWAYPYVFVSTLGSYKMGCHKNYCYWSGWLLQDYRVGFVLTQGSRLTGTTPRCGRGRGWSRWCHGWVMLKQSCCWCSSGWHTLSGKGRWGLVGFFVSVCLLWCLPFLSFCFWYLSFLIFLAFLCFWRTVNFTAFLSLVCVDSLLHVNFFGHESTLITKPLTTKVITLQNIITATSQPVNHEAVSGWV